jgi:hypothetical protein
MKELLEKLRQKGWHVAVHNDYHTQLGGWCTFWLFTKGRLAAKGEGSTDEDALRGALAQAECAEKSAERAKELGVHLPHYGNLI